MKDVICGMKVDDKGKYTSIHLGRTYYFCSANCKSTFDKNPVNYV